MALSSNTLGLAAGAGGAILGLAASDMAIQAARDALKKDGTAIPEYINTIQKNRWVGAALGAAAGYGVLMLMKKREALKPALAGGVIAVGVVAAQQVLLQRRFAAFEKSNAADAAIIKNNGFALPSMNGPRVGMGRPVFNTQGPVVSMGRVGNAWENVGAFGS